MLVVVNLVEVVGLRDCGIFVKGLCVDVIVVDDCCLGLLCVVVVVVGG